MAPKKSTKPVATEPAAEPVVEAIAEPIQKKKSLQLKKKEPTPKEEPKTTVETPTAKVEDSPTKTADSSVKIVDSPPKEIAKKTILKKTKEPEVLLESQKTSVSIKSKRSHKKSEEPTIVSDDSTELDYRQIIANYDPKKNKSRPFMTRFEIALIIGKRAKQIETGAIPNIEVKLGQTPIQIAEEELRQRKTPFIIKRTLGTQSEYWKPIDMEIIL